MTARGPARAKLLGFQRRRGIERVEIAAILDALTCLTCLRNDGRIMSLGEALLEAPLPCLGCTCHVLNDTKRRSSRAKCRCTYVALSSSPEFAEALADAKVDEYRNRLKKQLISAHTRAPETAPD